MNPDLYKDCGTPHEAARLKRIVDNQDQEIQDLRIRLAEAQQSAKDNEKAAQALELIGEWAEEQELSFITKIIGLLE